MPVPRVSAALVALLALLVLGAGAHLRGAEYDEQYTAFLLAGDARPAWPAEVQTVAEMRARLAGTASAAGIAGDLRRTDVHPPLYFWAAAAWRGLAGGSLERLRLFSVLCSLGALGAVGLIARRLRLPAALAMALTLGCYAFAYTATVARGFALAQLLSLLGVAFALRGGTRASGGAGLLLGAASFTNYLAAFAAPPVLLFLVLRRAREAAWAAAGLAPFVLADLFFFAAQHASRAGQFPAFHLGAGLARLATYGAASLTGGLPLYVPTPLAAPVGAFAATAVLGAALLVAARWRGIANPPARWLLLGLAAATPAGLLLLGVVFNTTPIELRYLAFATPYLALLLAGALGTLRRAAPFAAPILALQAAALAGLLLRAETMQPMRAAAQEAEAAGPGTVILLPAGNDGVGIVGAFLAEAPGATRLMLISRDTRAAALHAAGPRVALAWLARDAESRAAIAAIRPQLDIGLCWRRTGIGSTLIRYEDRCEGDAWTTSVASR